MDSLRPSRLSTLTLSRSSGAATPTVKGLLAMGSPPNVTTIVSSPCKHTPGVKGCLTERCLLPEHADPSLCISHAQKLAYLFSRRVFDSLGVIVVINDVKIFDGGREGHVHSSFTSSFG